MSVSICPGLVGAETTAQNILRMREPQSSSQSAGHRWEKQTITKKRTPLFSPVRSSVCNLMTEVNTVYNIVLGKRVPRVQRRKERWKEGWIESWRRGACRVQMKLCPFGSAPPSQIRTGTTSCLCTSASSVERGENEKLVLQKTAICLPLGAIRDTVHAASSRSIGGS